MGKRKVTKIIFYAAAALAVCCMALFIVFSALKSAQSPRKSTLPVVTASDADRFYAVGGQTRIEVYSGTEKISEADVSEKLAEAGVNDSTVLATASGKGDYLYAVTEGKTTAALSSDGQLLFSGRVTGIPYFITGNDDGSIMAVLMRSSLSSGLAVFDIADGTYERIVLDCDGKEAFVTGSGANAVLHVIKDDVQLVSFDVHGNELGSLIIDDVPIAADYRDGMLYVLSDDGKVRVVDTADYSLKETVFVDKEATDIAYSEVDGAIIVSSYNRRIYSVDATDYSVRSAASVYEASALFVDGVGNAVIRTRTGATYAYETSRIAAYIRYDILRIVFVSLFAATAACTVVFTFLAFGKARTGLKKFAKGVVKHRFVIAVLLPIVVFVAIFCYYPVVSGFVYSFMDYKPGAYARFAGFANYVTAFTNKYFWKGFLNLLIFGGTGLIKALIPPIIVALLLLALRSKKLQYFFRVTLYLPAILPGVAGLMLWTNGIYGPSGLLNSVLTSLGYKSVVWLGNKNTVVWMLTLIGFPWLGSFLVFYGALNNIPDSYIESARLEGCGYFKALFKIKLPLIMPQIKYVITMSLVGILQEFNLVYLTTNGGPGDASYVPMLEIYKQITFQNYGVASAMGVIMFFVLFAFTMINLRSTLGKKGEDV